MQLLYHFKRDVQITFLWNGIFRDVSKFNSAINTGFTVYIYACIAGIGVYYEMMSDITAHLW